MELAVLAEIRQSFGIIGADHEDGVDLTVRQMRKPRRVNVRWS